MFVNNTGQVPDMVIFSCALWDIARWVGTHATSLHWLTLTDRPRAPHTEH